MPAIVTPSSTPAPAPTYDDVFDAELVDCDGPVPLDDGVLVDAEDAAAPTDDDFLTVERADAPPQRSPARAQSWLGQGLFGRCQAADPAVPSPMQLALAHGRRAVVDERAPEGQAWADLTAFCLGQGVDLDAVLTHLAADPNEGGAPQHPVARLFGQRRDAALAALLPHLRAATYGPLARLDRPSGGYLGEVDGARRPHGEGLLACPSGARVRGSWCAGVPQGRATWRRDGASWSGPVDPEGRREGNGILRTAEGLTLFGLWRADVVENEATVFFGDGRRYTGQLTRESPPLCEGHGRLFLSEESWMEGTFVAGQLSGPGEGTFPATSHLHGLIWRGPFRAGRMHGCGRLRPLRGAGGEGWPATFVDGQLMGEGPVLTFPPPAPLWAAPRGPSASLDGGRKVWRRRAPWG